MWSPVKAWDLLWMRFGSFSGRSTRGEYVYALLLNLILWIAMVFFFEIHSFLSMWLLIILMLGAMLFLIIQIVPVQVRRLHDLNLSGHWVWAFIALNFINSRMSEFNIISIIALIPYIGLAIIPSQHKTNRFGADPTADLDDYYQSYKTGKNNLNGVYLGKNNLSNSINLNVNQSSAEGGAFVQEFDARKKKKIKYFRLGLK